MGTDDNKAILRRFIEEAFNQGNLAVVDELVASDYINHVAGTDVSGREGTRQFIYQLSRSAARLPLHDCGSGCGRGQGRDPLDSQRHTGGGVMGIPPTGRHVSISGIVVDRVADGKLAEMWLSSPTSASSRRRVASPAFGRAG